MMDMGPQRVATRALSNDLPQQLHGIMHVLGGVQSSSSPVAWLLTSCRSQVWSQRWKAMPEVVKTMPDVVTPGPVMVNLESR